MDKPEYARATMTEHKMNCAQTVLTVFSDDFGLDKTTALKLAAAFGGGMGRTGNTCGAVTGAYMAIGLAQRDLDPNNPRPTGEKVVALVAEFNKQFKAAHDSLLCRELLGHDLSTPEGFAEMRDKKLHVSICSALVADAVRIAEGLLR